MGFINRIKTQEKTKEDCLKRLEIEKKKGEVVRYNIEEKITFQGLPFLLTIDKKL